jgi:hypothetical protein
VKLYRAAQGPQATRGAHFCADLEVARVYLSGDRQLFVYELETERRLDARGGLKPVALALEVIQSRPAWQIEEEWWSLKLKSAFDLLETQPGVCELLAGHFDWVCYDEDYPPGAEGWLYLGGIPLVGMSLS